uniref:Sugar transporter SWEET1 n=3 Tax=Monodelphis domestica TaxID=13616 RepID=F6UKD7_MONDO
MSGWEEGEVSNARCQIHQQTFMELMLCPCKALWETRASRSSGCWGGGWRGRPNRGLLVGARPGCGGRGAGQPRQSKGAGPWLRRIMPGVGPGARGGARGNQGAGPELLGLGAGAEMEPADAIDTLLSGACVLFTLCMFSTGLSDLRHMQTTRSVTNIQFLPFLTTDVNNLSWLSYGLLKGDRTLIVVNALGALLQTLYILTYLHYCPRKRTVLLQTAALLGLLLLGYSYFQLLVPDWTTRLRQLGLFCSIFTITMYLSPLADLIKIIQTKSTQCLSFSLTVATFLASISWTLYGFHLSDLYIMVPNIPGIITSVIRLGLFWQYPQVQEKSYSLLQT